MDLFLDKCPAGWYSNNGSCYKLETLANLEQFSQRNGAKHCKDNHNGFLSVINTRREMDGISSYIKGMSVRYQKTSNTF